MGIFEVFIGGDKLHIHLWSRPLPHFEKSFPGIEFLIDSVFLSFFLSLKQTDKKTTLNTYIFSLMASNVSDEKSAEHLCEDGLYVISHFSFASSKVSFFVIIFQQFDYKCILGWISLSSSCLEVVELLDAYIHVFP